MKVLRQFVSGKVMKVRSVRLISSCIVMIVWSACLLHAEEWVPFLQSGYYYDSHGNPKTPWKNWTIWCCFEHDDGWSIGCGALKDRSISKDTVAYTAWYGGPNVSTLVRLPTWEDALFYDDGTYKPWCDHSLVGRKGTLDWYGPYLYTIPSSYAGKDITRIEDRAFSRGYVVSSYYLKMLGSFISKTFPTR